MSAENLSFENALNELEKIIAKLESGECSLEESIALFEDGVKRTNECRTILAEAKKKITLLTDIAEEETVD